MPHTRKLYQNLASHVLIMSLGLLALSWYMLADKHFFISDTALRYIQIINLIENNWQTLAINYPLRPYDAELQHVPYYVAFSVINGQIFFQITPFFPIVTSYLYYLLGSFGLAIVPASGTILTAIALYLLIRLAELPYAKLALWATVIATPLLFYSVKLWDHTLAVALTSWAVYSIVRSQKQKQPLFLLLGGLCLGFGLGQRPELYAFTLAIGLAFLVTYPSVKATAILIFGGLLGALPVWIAQWVWVGHPLGMAFAPHLLGYGKHATYAAASSGYDRPYKVVSFLIDNQLQTSMLLVAIIALLFGITLIIWAVRAQTRWTAHLLFLGATLLVVGYGIYSYYASIRLLNGLIPSFPLIVFAILYPQKDKQWFYDREIYKFVGATAVGFLLIMLTFWPSFGGTQWGSRYLLPIYPLLLFMALFSFASYQKHFQQAGTNNINQHLWRAIGILLLLLSIFLQMTSIHTLHQNHERLGRLQDAVSSLSVDIIITNHLFLPTLMAPLADKHFLYVETEEDVSKLLSRLIDAGQTQVGIIPGQNLVDTHPPLIVPTIVDGVPILETQPLIYTITPVQE